MIYKSNSNNPFFNIAFENFLLTKDRDDNDHILYLWRNGPSVIIGRFQSAWKECQVTSSVSGKRGRGGVVFL
jgi:lipoate-protein ligase A